MAALSYFVIILCSVTALSHGIDAKTDFELQFENFTCAAADESGVLLKKHKCGLSGSAKRRTLNMEFSLKRDIQQFDYTVRITMPREAEDFQLLNVTSDGCKMLANKQQVTLLSIGRDIVKRYSNFPDSCPLLKNKVYFIRNLRVDLDLIPAVSMESPVHAYWSYQLGDVHFMRSYLKARIVHKASKIEMGLM